MRASGTLFSGVGRNWMQLNEAVRRSQQAGRIQLNARKERRVRVNKSELVLVVAPQFFLGRKNQYPNDFAGSLHL